MIKGDRAAVFSLAFALLATFAFCVFAEDGKSAGERKKRDPFVALVDYTGKIKSYEDLFPTTLKKPLSADVAVKAIIWDEKRPLAFINNKIYGEGAEIAKDLTIEKINFDSVVLNDQGNAVTVKLRKTSKPGK